MQRSTKT